MRGNGWVGGLIRYIRRKDGPNAAKTQQRRAKDGHRAAQFLEKRVSSSRMGPQQG